MTSFRFDGELPEPDVVLEPEPATVLVLAVLQQLDMPKAEVDCVETPSAL
jgi:hypothetical protein